MQKGLEAILDGAIADGDGQMSFAAAGLAVENQRAALGDEIRSQVGTEQRLTQGRLQTKVELINGLEEGKVSLAGTALQAGLLAMGHFFGQQKSKKITIAPVFFLGSIRHVLVDTTCVRQVQPSEQRLQLPFGKFRDGRHGPGLGCFLVIAFSS